MAYYIGSVTNSSGSFSLAHENFLEVLKNFLDSITSYTILRYDTSSGVELIVKTIGISGDDEIYFGFKTYKSVSNDYYNIYCSTLLGYLSGEDFLAQPTFKRSILPAHNTSIYCLISANENLCVGALKVGSPETYMHFGAGKFLAAGTPSQYSAPFFNAGMTFDETKRYNDSSLYMPWHGGSYDKGSYSVSSKTCALRVRDKSGADINPRVFPFSNYDIDNFYNFYKDNIITPINGKYLLTKLGFMNDKFGNLDEYNGGPPEFFGWSDIVYYVSGYSNGSLNVIQEGGTYLVDPDGKTTKEIVDEIIDDAEGSAFVVIADCNRSGFHNFIAMEMS